MIKKLVRFVSVSIVAATMVACGGGGGNSGGTAPLPIVGGEGGDDTTQNPPQNPTPPPAPTPATGLDRLLGTVTLAYRFTGTTTVFTTRTTFSNASYSVTSGGNTVLQTTDLDRSIACSTLDQSPAYEYLCAVVRSTDGSGQVTSQNIFLFNLTSSTEGEGLFEFCSGEDVVGNACVNALLAQPDGPLAVSISQQLAKATGATSVNGLAVTDAESDVFHAAVEAEFGSTPSAGSSTLAGGDELKQAYQALMDQLN